MPTGDRSLPEAITRRQTPPTAGGRRYPGDPLVAIVIAATALAVYVTTLAPGLIAITDTPKFQFVGRILGIAHAPGYPLYVMVSHLFGYLPIGSLAYRINLMSAVFGAAACGLTFLCARLLGASRPVAAAAALGFAFGPTAWYVSTIAEVYALNAFLVASTLAALLAWQRSRRAALFYTAVAIVGVAAGNHTTIVFLVPATAIFACLVAPRFALHPRTIATAAAVVALGLTQYAFIIVRSRQGAWGDQHAWTVTDLVRMVAGSQYFGDLMPDGIGRFFTERLPLIGRTFVLEMSAVGVTLAAAGTVALSARPKPVLALLATAVLAHVAFAAAYTPVRFEVFLVPAFLMSWLLAAVGTQWAIEAMSGRGWRLSAAVASVLFVLVPARQFAHNYRTQDLSHNRADMRFFDALFDRLPDDSVLLHEDFLVDRMVYYKTLGEGVADGRRILALMPPDPASVERMWRGRREVFAFPQTARLMRLLDGAQFSYSPLDLASGTLDQYLDDLPLDSTVALGIPGRHLVSFAPGGRLSFEAIGVAKDIATAGAQGVAVIAKRGGGTADRIARAGTADLRLDSIDGVLNPAPAPIEVHVDQEVATIKLGGREIIRSTTGMVVAVWRDRALAALFALPAAAPHPPPPPTPYAVYPLQAVHERRQIGSSATDLSAEAMTGNLVYRIGSGRSRLVLYAGRRRALAPALIEVSARSWPTFELRTFDQSRSGGDELSAALREDSISADTRLLGMPHVYRMAIDTDWPDVAGMIVGFGGVPDVVLGRLLSGSPGLAYALDLRTHLALIEPGIWSFHMARDHHAQLVGAGWTPVLADPVGPYRESIDAEAELLLPIHGAGPVRLGVQLAGRQGTDGATPSVSLQINQRLLPAIEPGTGWQRYWWEVPPDAIRDGVNDVVLTISPPGNKIAVSDVLIETAAPSR